MVEFVLAKIEVEFVLANFEAGDIKSNGASNIGGVYEREVKMVEFLAKNIP